MRPVWSDRRRWKNDVEDTGRGARRSSREQTFSAAQRHSRGFEVDGRSGGPHVAARRAFHDLLGDRCGNWRRASTTDNSCVTGPIEWVRLRLHRSTVSCLSEAPGSFEPSFRPRAIELCNRNAVSAT